MLDNIEILKLNKNFDFKYIFKVEQGIQQKLCKQFSTLKPGLITEGYAPSHDFEINGRKIELKITAGDYTQRRGKLTPNLVSVEFERINGKPSGIQKCEADYYIWIVPGYTKVGKNTSKLVGKLRCLRAEQFHLKCWEESKKPKKIIEWKDKKDTGGGSRCVLMNLKNFSINNPDAEIAIADCGVIEKNGRIVEYDLTDIQYQQYFSYKINEWFGAQLPLA